MFLFIPILSDASGVKLESKTFDLFRCKLLARIHLLI